MWRRLLVWVKRWSPLIHNFNSLKMVMTVVLIIAVWLMSVAGVRMQNTDTTMDISVSESKAHDKETQDKKSKNNEMQDKEKQNKETHDKEAQDKKLKNNETKDKEIQDKKSKNNEMQNNINGKTIVIDPGHGGIDSGKVGINGEYEKKINLEISEKLKEYLENEGFIVYLTRSNDEGLYLDSDSNKKASDMKKRCDIIYSEKADIAVSIHQNSFTDEAVRGAQVFFYTHSEEGKKLANIIQESIKNIADSDNTRIEKANDSYYMLINTKCPTVIVECGFLSNREEADRLAGEEYQKLIAKAIGEGIKEYVAD